MLNIEKPGGEGVPFFNIVLVPQLRKTNM